MISLAKVNKPFCTSLLLTFLFLAISIATNFGETIQDATTKGWVKIIYTPVYIMFFLLDLFTKDDKVTGFLGILSSFSIFVLYFVQVFLFAYLVAKLFYKYFRTKDSNNT